MRKILFVSDRDKIIAESFPLLEAVRATLVQNPDILRARVEGYSDSRGDVDHNLQLSAARANAVMSYLIEAGINPERLEAVGFGEANPIADNDTEAGRQKNRRVEFSIVKQSEDAGKTPPAEVEEPEQDDEAPPAEGEEAPPAG